MLNLTIDSLVIKKFFHWWKKELSFLIPNAIRKFFNEAAGFIIIQIKGNEIFFSKIHENKLQPLACLELNEKGLAAYQQPKLDYLRAKKSKVILRLNKNEGIIKTLILPKAVEENLAQVITYELNRYTPFNQQQVYYAIKKIATDTDKIYLQLILTPKNKLDTSYETLKDWGITPWLVDYEGAANHLHDNYEYYNLLPEEKKYQFHKKALVFQSILIIAIFLLLSSILILPIGFQYQSVQSLEHTIQSLKKRVAVVQKLQHKMAILSKKTDWLIAQKKKYPPLIEILDTVSRLLKDDTWLSLIEYKNEKLHLTGESPAASTLIKVLESSPLFSNADFESVVTKNKVTGLEIFRIIVSVNSNGNYGAD